VDARIAHVSGPLRLQPELYPQTALGGVVVLVRKPGVTMLRYINAQLTLTLTLTLASQWQEEGDIVSRPLPFTRGRAISVR